MKYITKTSSLLMAIMLIFQLVGPPVIAIADTVNDSEDENITSIAHSEELTEIPVYDENSDSSNIIHTVKNGTEVTILDSAEDFSHVEFTASNSSKLVEGYISNEYLIPSDEFDNSSEEQESDIKEESTEDNIESDDEETLESDETDKSDSNNSDDDPKNEDDSDVHSNEEDSKLDNTDEKTDEKDSSSQDKSVLESTFKNQENVTGIGIRNPTNVRERNSTKSNVIASYPEGTVIDLKTFSKNWYEVTVDVNGKETSGYVHHKHVDVIYETQESKNVVGLRNPTNVRTLASTKSDVKTSYPQGTIIKVKTFTKDWYEITDNGKTLGYIHHKHVGDIEKDQSSLQGIGINNPTNIRELASTKSKVLTSLPIGTIIDLETFSDNWYEATAKVDGKVIKGFIHHKHIGDTVETKQKSFKAIGINNPTYIRTRPSTKATHVKALPVGSIINLKTFSKHWYEATVNVNGKKKTGYVHKKHIGDQINNKNSSFKGYGINDPTQIRVRPSTEAKSAGRLPVGSIIDLKSFSKHWYKATAKVNGKKINGYIHKKHFHKANGTGENSYGEVIKKTTIIRGLPSTNANVAKRLKKGNVIELEDFSKYWYKATPIGNEKWTGYVHKNHVKITDSVEKKYGSYSNAVNAQMKQSPQVSGFGRHGGFRNASKEQVEYYINPSNFTKNSREYLQFLVLSEPAGLDKNEVNSKVLKGLGVLDGKGASFIKAAKKFDINEAYLISHAKLETGNGTSTLAKGVPVDKKGNIVDKKKAYKTVYNVYGIGAVDSNALAGGAKRAFDEGWFTVDKAIVGGAQFINTYIGRGQDTLYKMRWNPESPGYPQYATDIGWAVKQTASMNQIYSLIDNYTHRFDVPKYKGQPSKSGNKNAYTETLLQVSASALNIRENAGTKYKSVGQASKGTKLTPIFNKKGEYVTKTVNGHIWYRINYKGKTAWASGGVNGNELVKLINK